MFGAVNAYALFRALFRSSPLKNCSTRPISATSWKTKAHRIPQVSGVNQFFSAPAGGPQILVFLFSLNYLLLGVLTKLTYAQLSSYSIASGFSLRPPLFLFGDTRWRLAHVENGKHDDKTMII